MKNPHCECPVAGYCKRHQMEKDARLHSYCQGTATTSNGGRDHWKAWELGKLGATAPDDPHPEAEWAPDPSHSRLRQSHLHGQNGPRKATESRDGCLVGSAIRELISARTSHAIAGGCGCRDIVRKMDRLGCVACQRDIDQCVRWLLDSANSAKWLAPMQDGRSAREIVTELVQQAIDQERQRTVNPAPIGTNIPVVMVTAPRDGRVHAQTLASIFGAGFDHVRVSAEPGTSLDGLQKLYPQARYTVQKERQGQWRHFIQALRIGIKTARPFFIACEDDVEFCRGTATFLAESTWPAADCGVLQLYAAKKYEQYGQHPYGQRSQLSDAQMRDLLGCCALMFRRDAAMELVNWAERYGWRGGVNGIVEDPRQKKAGDKFVGEILLHLGFSGWIHNPCIVTHIGWESSLGHNDLTPNRIPLNFPGIDADLRTIFNPATP